MCKLKFLIVLLFLVLSRICPAQSFMEERDLLGFFESITGEADNANSCERYLKTGSEKFVREKNTITIIAPIEYYNYMDLHSDSTVCRVNFKEKGKHINLVDSLVRMDRFVIGWYKNYKTARKDLKRLCKQFDLELKKSGEKSITGSKNVYLPVKDDIYMGYSLDISLNRWSCKKKCKYTCDLYIALLQNF